MDHQQVPVGAVAALTWPNASSRELTPATTSTRWVLPPNLPPDALARARLATRHVGGAARRWFELGGEAAVLRCCAWICSAGVLDA
jgi:hypothetical protein